jgi:hypothetical protein|tara:strand:+ start:136 stop:1068 length:933 start_codon:yes stop_codon:yes gene_type:complete
MKIFGLNQLPNKTKSAISFINELIDIIPPSIVDGATIESTKIIDTSTSIKNTRETLDIDDNKVLSTVSNFEENGYIRLDGEYKQNFVDFTKVDISNVKVVDGTTFRFFLSIKENFNDSNPILYTSKKFYDELVNTYLNNNPYNVNASTRESSIVVIILDTLKQKVESLHDGELNRTGENGVLVLENLFATANFDIDIDPSVDDYKNAVSNPSYNIDDIVRYIDWAVSKPNASYEDRLISGKELGRWRYNNAVNETKDSSFPSLDGLPNNLNNPTTFPPFGRPGDFQNEVDSDDNNTEWKWNINTNKWDKL